MSHSSRSRAQTEPLAALVAIAAVVVAIGVYATVVTDAFPGTSDRNPAEATVEQVWHNVGSDGVFHEGESLATGVHTPDGFSVYVEVTTVENGREQVVSSLLLRPDGSSEHTRGVERPESVQTTSRPISVQLRGAPDGDVRSGTLRVEVW